MLLSRCGATIMLCKILWTMLAKNDYLCITMKGEHRYRLTACRGYCLVVAVAVVVFYVFNVLTTLKPDDLHFSMMAGSDDVVPITSWGDLMRSWSVIFYTDNGRLANYLTQLFAAIAGKGAFDIANALIFGLFLVVTGRCITGGWQESAIALLTCLAVLLIFPYPGETMLWMCGSLNYLWSATLSLLLVCCVASGRQAACCHARLVAVTVLALLAGWMQESASYPVCFGWIAWMALRGSKPSRMELLALAGYVLGAVIVTCSPAAWERLLDAGAGSDASLLATVMQHGKVLALRSVRYVVPVLALLVIVYDVCKRGGREVARDWMTWIWLGNVILLFILADPNKQRLYFFYVVVSYIIVARWLYGIVAGRRQVLRIAACVLALACVCPVVAAIGALKAYRHGVEAVEARIAAAPANCVLESFKPPYSRWIASNYFDSLSFNDYNTLFRHHYGKAHMAFLRKPLYERYQRADFLAGGTVAHMASSNAKVIKNIYLFPGQDFSIIPIDSAAIDTSYAARHMVLDLNARHNRNTAPGMVSHCHRHLDVHNEVTYFWVKHRGDFYLITLPVEDDVDHLEIPAMAGAKHIKVKLDRVKNL